MIIVTIELRPHGQSAGARELGRLIITNDGSGDTTTANYTGTLYAEYTHALGRTGTVKNFRRTKQSVWTLVGRFLHQWNHK